MGNGDMHLKNWSLIYPDRRNALLAPAYDLLSTLAYIPGDDAALKFHSSREWASYTYDELEAIADKAKLPAKLITATAKDVVARFDDAWRSESGHLPFPDDVRSAIERHRKTLAI